MRGFALYRTFSLTQNDSEIFKAASRLQSCERRISMPHPALRNRRPIMNSHFDSSSSGIARVISVLVAFVMTAALFSAVVMGLTGEEGSLLAQGGDTTIVQA
jgi:hypothetical protein